VDFLGCHVVLQLRCCEMSALSSDGSRQVLVIIIEEARENAGTKGTRESASLLLIFDDLGVKTNYSYIAATFLCL
jgi:hypothetical protein